jgi:hypothetical protein
MVRIIAFLLQQIQHWKKKFSYLCLDILPFVLPCLTALEICKSLDIPYQKKQNYVNGN